jgi:hypothetical protein
MEWEVTFNAVFRARLEELHAEARSVGQDEAFAAGFQNLFGRLRADPFEVGEIRYRLSGGQPVHGAAKGPVAIQFAIYETNSVVWITSIDRLASPNE